MDTCHGPGCRTLHSVRRRKTSDGDKPSEAGRRRTSNAGAGRWETEDVGGGCRIETIDAGGGCRRGSGDAGGGCRPKTSDSGRCRRRSEDEPPAPVPGDQAGRGGEGEGQGARADNPPVQVIQLNIFAEFAVCSCV